MLIQIFLDCEDMKILKTLFVLVVELDLYKLFPNFLCCMCQNYRHIWIFLHYILDMWNCLILLEQYFPYATARRSEERRAVA